jgi:pyruvate/2-oxoglutarate dehydrogenase complex dihydrolipoamide acyltransferase (E2) component
MTRHSITRRVGGVLLVAVLGVTAAGAQEPKPATPPQSPAAVPTAPIAAADLRAQLEERDALIANLRKAFIELRIQLREAKASSYRNAQLLEDLAIRQEVAQQQQRAKATAAKPKPADGAPVAPTPAAQR